MFSIIVAVSENNVIGNDNKLIWHLPADLAYFKKVTMSKTIVMGRKTFESIGRPLPGRKNVVITRSHQFSHENVTVLQNPQSLLVQKTAEELVIIGGAEIYRIFLPLADKIYFTRVHHNFQGDAFFPEINRDEWIKKSEEFHSRDEKNAYDYSFIVYERKNRL